MLPVILGLLAAVLFIIFIVNIKHYRRIKDGDWHHHEENMMRRWDCGEWDHRPMTKAERIEYVDYTVWS